MNKAIVPFAIIAIAALSVQAVAAPTDAQSSTQFTYQYEMDALLGTQNLDGNGTEDWFNGAVSGLTQPTVSGGFGVSDQTASPAEILWRTDFGGSLTRATVTGDFTIEFSVQLEAGTQDGGDVGTFGVAFQQPGQTQSIRINIDEDNVNGGGLGTVATTSNTDTQHVYRVAREGTNNWYLWRDGVLLNSDLATPVAGSNGNVNSGGFWFLGDFTGSLSGEWDVDYIRVTESVVAPNIVIDNLDLSGAVTGGAQSNYQKQSFTPNVAGIGLSDTVADNAPLTDFVALESATFLRSPDGAGDSTDGQIFIDVYLGIGNGGTYVGSSSNSIDIDAIAADEEMTWFFDNLELDSTLEYALVFSTDALEGGVATARLTAANNGGGFINTYSGGTADDTASGVSPVTFDARFAVRFTAIPTPAALPAGLAMLGIIAARRRRK